MCFLLQKIKDAIQIAVANKYILMKIVVYGTGGVGGYFGTRLAQSGNEVHFVARGKHLEAIQKKGLQLKSIKGDHTVFPVHVTDNVRTISNPDLVIVATKTWQVAEAAKDIKPILNHYSSVLPLLNGVTNTDALLSVLDEQQVIGGLCKIVSKIEDYGVINHMAIEPYIAFGQLDNQKGGRIQEIKTVFDEAGISNDNPDDIQKAIWSKFLFITTVSAIGGLTRATLGEMRTAPEVRAIMLQTAEEIVQLANAKGVVLNRDSIDKTFHFIDGLPYETTASLQRDIMEGRPSELESQVGTVHNLGLELGIDTTANTFIYHSLLPQEARARR